MIPVVYDMPPKPAVDEAHLVQIKRVAVEIEARAQFGQKQMVESRTFRENIRRYALQSEMSDAAFRLLVAFLELGDDDATETCVGDDVLGAVLRRSRSSLGRARKELEKGGWLETRRNGREKSIAQTDIPAHAHTQIVKEIFDVSDLTHRTELPRLPEFRREAFFARFDASRMIHQDSRTKLLDAPDLTHQENTDVADLQHREGPDKIDAPDLAHRNPFDVSEVTHRECKSDASNSKPAEDINNIIYNIPTTPIILAGAENDERFGLGWVGEQLVAANGHAPLLERLLGGKLPLSEALGRVAPELDKSLSGYELEMETAAAIQRLALEIEKVSTKPAPKKRESPNGTRLAADWWLPKSWGVWAMDYTGREDAWVRLEADKFRDFWHAKAGAAARKVDWEATWRNWVRKADHDNQGTVTAARSAGKLSFDAQDRAEADEITQWINSGMKA